MITIPFWLFVTLCFFTGIGIGAALYDFLRR